ncbi:MAG TPA: FHA domain-containing protein [Casimicrobiaceae bacterium]|nr:FHA domain-containing protein [Casimicrobiaceae bacterium]
MSIKNWIMSKVSGVAGRADLPRSPVLTMPGEPPSVLRRGSRRREPSDTLAAPLQHLGPYAPLIGAIREELEQFVLSYLGLHLVIAERDRYLLTSIEVHATAADDAELLRRFVREFKPEQIKRYLAKEVIAGLPNASALDLSQFAGLDAGVVDDTDEDDAHDYSELLAELKSAEPAASVKPFEVRLVGRWSEMGAAAPIAAYARGDVARTPLAGVALTIDDADGTHQLSLASPVPGLRYAIGKDAGCDVVVNGRYVSRRHCEIWLDRGAWWIADAGSTNGVRVERGASVLGRSGGDGAGAAPTALELTPGVCIVLSAHAEGGPAQYPRLVLEAKRDASGERTPIAPGALRATPATPILGARETAFTLNARMAGGQHVVEVRGAGLPVSVGRSRSQTLVVDWAHEGVSGRHLAISAIDEHGVTVEVYGDNGVSVAGKTYPQGAQLRWKPGEPMTLGRTIGNEPECQLTLERLR